MDKEIKVYKRILENDISILEYGSLRFSIFEGEKYNRQEYQVRIEYYNGNFEVYTTRDRASVVGKYKFKDFENARAKFIRLLELMVLSNKDAVKDGEPPEYSCSLWDKQ